MTQTRMISKMGSLSGAFFGALNAEEVDGWVVGCLCGCTDGRIPPLPSPLHSTHATGMMKMIPGMAGVLPGEAMYEGEKKLFAYQEMINVMEPEERCVACVALIPRGAMRERKENKIHKTLLRAHSTSSIIHHHPRPHRKDPKILLDNPGADLRWKRIVEDSGACVRACLSCVVCHVAGWVANHGSCC